MAIRPKQAGQDQLVWKENSKNQFSVRLAYHVGTNNMTLWNTRQQELIYLRGKKSGLSTSIPPKVRTFIWRACSKILPTQDNLSRRKMRIEPQCVICCQEAETTGHLLWSCPLARNAWALARGKLQKLPNMRLFFLLYQQLNARLELKAMERWAMISWAIWNARNKLHFEKTQVPPKAVSDGAIGFLEEYQKLMIAQRHSQAFFPIFCFRTGLSLGLLYVYTFFDINIQYLLSEKKWQNLAKNENNGLSSEPRNLVKADHLQIANDSPCPGQVPISNN